MVDRKATCASICARSPTCLAMTGLSIDRRSSCTFCSVESGRVFQVDRITSCDICKSCGSRNARALGNSRSVSQLVVAKHEFFFGTCILSNCKLSTPSFLHFLWGLGEERILGIETAGGPLLSTSGEDSTGRKLGSALRIFDVGLGRFLTPVMLFRLT